MLLVSDKYDLVNKRTQEISELMKLGLHIQGVWQNAHKVIRQLAHWSEETRVINGEQFIVACASVQHFDPIE